MMNMTKAVSDVLEMFKDRFDGYPSLGQFDDGKEFFNFKFLGVKSLLEKHKDQYFSTK